MFQEKTYGWNIGSGGRKFNRNLASIRMSNDKIG